VWVSPLKPGPQGQPGSNIVDIPSGFGVPYQTSQTLNGNPIYAIRLSLSALPNASSASISIPASVTSVWDVENSWIETSQSFVKGTLSDKVLPLPYLDVLSLSDGIQVHLETAGQVVITTGSDRSNYEAVVTLYYVDIS